ncbi:hypothetical protein HOB10_02410 [Candidatus Parcubacteria bacterium]|nr:hypothetical protein [Candidatus Parcubacteria bacterium]
MNNKPYIPPKNLQNKMKPATTSGNADKSNWTMSYRLQGMAIGLIAVAIYCYTYLQYWPKTLIISAGIFGYFAGWVVGSWAYKKKD